MERQGEADSIQYWMDVFEQQWRSGRSPRIEEYLPRVATSLQGQLQVELIAVEVQLRRTAGETVSIEHFLERFPSQQERIRRGFSLADESSRIECDESLADTHSVVGPVVEDTVVVPQAHLAPQPVGKRNVADERSGNDFFMPPQLGRYRIVGTLGEGGIRPSLRGT